MGNPDTHVPNRFVEENVFLKLPREEAALPEFDSSKNLLPEPHWQGHETVLNCYWKAWAIAFGNLRQPPPPSPLIANFIDTAFNDCTFMWDSCFMTMFGRYGCRAFNFQRTLDNFYSRQHQDGFICREIAVGDGADRFERFDPSSTGPNLMPWAEWDYYRHLRDRERLGRVFPVLVGYYQWLRTHRSWPDGSYWSSGWGCGMDNQPRLPAGAHVCFDHGHLSWIDTTLQQIFSGKLLLKMAAELGRAEDPELQAIARESHLLTDFVNHRMWEDSTAFYYDRFRDGSLSRTKSIAAYWALLAGVVPRKSLLPFIDHLRNPAEFARPHRVPTLSADDPAYEPNGGYWLGSVWAPTNYMVLRGLGGFGSLGGFSEGNAHELSDTMAGLAHEIALNHLSHLVKVFETTGTLWENYAPESSAPGNPGRRDFVGWTGLSPIAILFENVLGLRAQVSRNELLWDVRLLEEHGVDRYPFGPDTTLELRCGPRRHPGDEPVVDAAIKNGGNRPVKLIVKWAGGIKNINCR